MLEVDVKKIISVTEARANIASLIDKVMNGDLYVLTRGGKPAVVVAPIEMAENMFGKKKTKSNLVNFEPLVKKEASSTDFFDKQEQPRPEEDEELPNIDLAKVNQALDEYEKQKAAQNR